MIDSAPQDFIVPNSAGKEHFIVHNFGNTYSGSISLADATASPTTPCSRRSASTSGRGGSQRLANAMGIRSPVSNNSAMILGGLKEGVSPLDMAHAYETFATGGNRVYNPVLGAPHQGPTGIAEIQCSQVKCDGKTDITDHPTYKRILPPAVASEVHDMLHGPVQFGTATNAQITGVDVAGKTGTTSDYGDAWFVGWTPQFTTAVWVGYPTSAVDGHGLQRRPGRGRHLPGDHLAELHDPGAADHRPRREAPAQGQEERQRQHRQQRQHGNTGLGQP